MFTLGQINDVHERVGDMRTLRTYVTELAAMGVKTYDSYVNDGHSEYFGTDEHIVVSPPTHEFYELATSTDKDRLMAELRLHEQAKTDYFEMSQALAASGVEKWAFDTDAFTITYFGVDGSALYSESIE